MKPNRIWAYDHTYFGAAGRHAVAIMDVVSHRWLTLVLSDMNLSLLDEVAFMTALTTKGRACPTLLGIGPSTRSMTRPAATLLGKRFRCY